MTQHSAHAPGYPHVYGTGQPSPRSPGRTGSRARRSRLLPWLGTLALLGTVVAGLLSLPVAGATASSSGGAVYAWGWNVSGQLGNGTYNTSDTPVQASLPAGVTAYGANHVHFDRHPRQHTT